MNASCGACRSHPNGCGALRPVWPSAVTSAQSHPVSASAKESENDAWFDETVALALAARAAAQSADFTSKSEAGEPSGALAVAATSSGAHLPPDCVEAPNQTV